MDPVFNKDTTKTDLKGNNFNRLITCEENELVIIIHYPQTKTHTGRLHCYNLPDI